MGVPCGCRAAVSAVIYSACCSFVRPLDRGCFHGFDGFVRSVVVGVRGYPHWRSVWTPLCQFQNTAEGQTPPTTKTHSQNTRPGSADSKHGKGEPKHRAVCLGKRDICGWSGDLRACSGNATAVCQWSFRSEDCRLSRDNAKILLEFRQMSTFSTRIKQSK